MQVDAFLKKQGVNNFTAADFEQDREMLNSGQERLSTERGLDTCRR